MLTGSLKFVYVDMVHLFLQVICLHFGVNLPFGPAAQLLIKYHICDYI